MLLSLALAQSLAASAPAAIPIGEELTQQIRTADAALFTAYFGQCEPSRMATMITPDIEMYHDRTGALIGQDAFMATYKNLCEPRRAPDAWRNRRALVENSLRVDPVPGFGAIEEGDHLFYERKGDGPEKRAGSAHFVQLWKWTPTGWQLARVFSYAHRAATAADAP
ncbi:nuclear transport factor 2 family protein [Sphingomonas sp. RS6]